MHTGFFYDEHCFWHGGGNYASMLPVGGHVQPMMGGLPENPETKRRLKNLMEVTGLLDELNVSSAAPATTEELARVHPMSYLQEFKQVSDAGGGELGRRTPFGPGGYEIAALSAGLMRDAVFAVLKGDLKNAYALSRPPGHHCLPDYPNGFCLLANSAIAIEAAKAKGLCSRVAVIDWDVHHGNGTEAIYYDRDDVLALSIHQERNYPMDSGDAEDRGDGKGIGYNINIPLPPGAGHATYLRVMDQLVVPALRAYKPDLIIVACGYDAAAIDPLSRMLATADTFRAMTARMKEVADDLCGGKLVLVHEGGYSEVYVPFCGHATIAELSSSKIDAPDPFAETFAQRQPQPGFQAYLDQVVDDLADYFQLG